MLGGVLALYAVGELGEPGRRKGDERVDIEKDCRISIFLVMPMCRCWERKIAHHLTSLVPS